MHPRPRLRLGIDVRAGLPAIITSMAVVLAACSGPSGSPTPGADDTLRVSATTTVLADLVAQVAGDAATVTSLVPKGGEVHTFDPTPSDLRTVTDADVVVMNGLGLDEWVGDVITDSGSSARIIELAEDLEGVTYLESDDRDEEAGASDDGTGHGAVNPHLWLDVAYAAKYVERIVDVLAEVDPEAAPAYRERGAAYLDRLAELDAWARERIATIPTEDRVIVSFHEALPYFAAAYGLEIAGTIVDAPGQDPSAGEIAALVEAIRSSGAKAVFGEVQFSPELVETVANEAGVVVESDLYTDSVGDPPVDTYEGLIRWDVDRVVAALGG